MPRKRAARALVFGALALVLALVFYALAHALPGNQAIARADVYAGIGTTYSWSGTAQAWQTDHRLVSHSDFVTFVQNNGACAGASNKILSSSEAAACATLANVHTPILANNSFAAGAITGWSSSFTYAGCGSGGTANAVNAADQDSDSGFASEGSGPLCLNGNVAIVSVSQTFTIAGNPSSQRYSVWYNWTPVNAGDVGCTQVSGAVNNFQVTINGHVQTTIPAPVGDGAWHQVSATTTDLLNGSNTFTVTASVSGARGLLPSGDFCTIQQTFAQTLLFDNATLTASY